MPFLGNMRASHAGNLFADDKIFLLCRSMVDCEYLMVG
jgi:hypothetical protein